MIYNGFKLRARPILHDANCTNKKCKTRPELLEISNGLLSTAYVCPDCKSVYILQLERVPKVSKEFKQHALDSLGANDAGDNARHEFWQKVQERKDAERDKRLARKPRTKKKNGKS